MNKKILGTAIIIAVLLLNFTTILARAQAPLEPHGADAMWVEPSSNVFVDGMPNATLGQKFNVTVWLNMTEDIYGWQALMHFNATLLNCARSGYTGGATSNYFKGHMTTAPGAAIDNVRGTVLIYESCLGFDFIAGPHNDSLFWAEFAILAVPTTGNFTSKLDISTEYGTTSRANTWVIASDGITQLSFNPYDGNYLFIGPSGPPPPLSVSISPLSSTIHVGQTVHFTSTVNDGVPPHSFQWFLNGTPVSGATSNSWNFSPTSSEFDTVYLTVTDSNGTIANSNNASVTVTPAPGGTRISVSPPEIINLTMGPSSTFDVNITLDNATNVRICIFNLTYVPSVIKWVGIQVLKVQDQFPTATLMADGDAGFVWVSLNYSDPISTDPPVPIVNLRFHVESYGISPMNLTDTQLLDSEGLPIGHDAFDGFFSNIIRDVAVINVVPETNWIYQGWIDHINVTVQNLGNVSETFTVSANYDGSLIGIVPVVNLPSKAQTTVTIAWDTTGVPEGNYTITGVASTVPYESNLANNEYVDGIVEVVTIIHDVAIIDVTPARSWVFHNNPLGINVTAENLGNVSETFNVTAYADNYTIGTFEVTNLASNAQITITFVWNTTAIPQCENYTIRGEASILPQEYNLTNNVYVDGNVTVRIMGDINGDGKVDGRDLLVLSRSFASFGPDYLYPGSPPSPNWNSDADLNLDNKVDGRDLIMAARNFGQTCP
jgi:hypothetical protein